MDAHLGTRIDGHQNTFRECWHRVPSKISQATLDAVVVQFRQAELTEAASADIECARLKAAFHPSSGKWLFAIPSSSVGTMLDNTTLRIAAGLRLGLPLCAPHLCARCSSTVSAMGDHGLCCSRSAGRHPRHRALNAVISRALGSAMIASQLEPTGLSRNSALRPDGITLSSWATGRSLVWDATVWDTLAPSHRATAVREAGAVAGLAETSKLTKYRELESRYIVQPIAFETLGVAGKSTEAFLKDLGRRIEAASGDRRASEFLLQRISIEIQRGNSAAVMGTLPTGPDLAGIG